MEQPILISIVVSIYNEWEYLDKCIDSIVNQTYKNIEIILVDDGSTDCCGEICDKYAEQDSRIIVIHKPNGGLVSARKAGTKEATGDYIINVDGDDWIEKERIQNLVKGIEQYHADIIYMDGYVREYPDNQVMVKGNLRRGFYTKQQVQEEILMKLASTNHFYEKNIEMFMWLWAFKRELIKEKQPLIDERISMGEDLACVCECLASTNSVSVIEGGSYHYTQGRVEAISYSNNLSSIRLEALWNQLKQFCKKEYVSPSVYQMMVVIMNQAVAITDFSLFFKKNCEYLYPYSKVKKNSNLVIYGAGKFGYKIMLALSDNDQYHVAAWVDKSNKRVTMEQYTISQVEILNQLDYDYIVVAILNYNVALGAVKELQKMGISEDKIAVMDADVISEDFLIFDEIKS
ncbi:MAG: glycosyltransferase family 2 protein [Lachnospira sp.]|nr:glycosyltransferase family 2 protein [Lachnospira sp.]